MSDQPTPDVGQVLLGEACKEIRRVSKLSTSYSRSIGEAARRGDEVTLEAHLKQLRLCCLAMIKTYKDYLKEKTNGQG
jgi:hypothetical protein